MKANRSIQIIERLEGIAEVLNSTPCLRVSAGLPRCSEAEDARLRPLVGRRGNPAVLLRDPDRMCDECAALELVQRAANRLRVVRA